MSVCPLCLTVVTVCSMYGRTLRCCTGPTKKIPSSLLYRHVYTPSLTPSRLLSHTPIPHSNTPLLYPLSYTFCPILIPSSALLLPSSPRQYLYNDTYGLISHKALELHRPFAFQAQLLAPVSVTNGTASASAGGYSHAGKVRRE